jgi:aspartate aminotransferase
MPTATLEGSRQRQPRAASLPASCLHDVFNAAEARERSTGRSVIGLHVGEPYLSPPREAVEALIAAARDGRATYCSAEGLLELREALVEKLERTNGHGTDVARVFVTPGSAQGLWAVLQSLAGRGDELLLPELHWPIHLQQCLLAGFRPAFYPLGPDLALDPAGLAAAASRRARAVLINTPANPTGAVLDAAALRAILELAQERDWQVISDEAYEHFVYRGDHVSIAALERDLPPRERRVFSTYSFSKSFAMTGYRLGYVVAPHGQAADALRKVQEATIVSPATPVQLAGQAALGAKPYVERHRNAVLASRDAVAPKLAAAGLLRASPAGGWYAVLDIGRTGLDGETFAARLLEQCDVAVAPARGFALRPSLSPDGAVGAIGESPAAHHLLRIALCGHPRLVVEGVERLMAFATTAAAG